MEENFEIRSCIAILANDIKNNTMHSTNRQTTLILLMQCTLTKYFSTNNNYQIKTWTYITSTRKIYVECKQLSTGTMQKLSQANIAQNKWISKETRPGRLGPVRLFSWSAFLSDQRSWQTGRELSCWRGCTSWAQHCIPPACETAAFTTHNIHNSLHLTR